MRLEHALRLAAAGFHIFPLKPDAKTPAHKGWQDEATTDHIQIRAWFEHGDFNIGVYAGKFGDGSAALLVLDVDNKGGKRGSDEIIRLELEGMDLPTCRETLTPTGGRHLFFKVPEPVRQGADVVARGLDVRSRGGYVVGPGSVTKDGEYVEVDGDLPLAPAWLVESCGRGRQKRERGYTAKPARVDAGRAFQRAVAYLENEAPTEDDPDAYKVACRVKDFGVDEATAVHLMQTHWDPRCMPPRSDNTVDPVHNAYRYGLDAPGVAAPEADFEPVAENDALFAADPAATDKLHPYDKLNREYAFCLAGGGAHILWETTDADTRFKLEHLSMSAFHDAYASWTIQIGDKNKPVTREWMKDPRRRSYDGVVFRPEMKVDTRFYNLWRGFAYEPWPVDKPVTKQAQASVDMFLEHALLNICRGEQKLCDWLIGYFAHLIQKPWEKPLVALVFKGSKGTGKNALIERVGALLGGHFLVTSNRRYLIGNFNGHLENCLLFTLDEAFWSGDKQAEGTLKDMITGKSHVIEHKGKEPYQVDNRTRVAIIGNEEWIVPASHDERRFAVFDVGEGRKQDRVFFQQMREWMEAGGYALLLRHLQGVDLAGFDANAAPVTAALLAQKHASLGPVHDWWLACLDDGRFVAADFEGGWGQPVECERLRAAFRRWATKDRNIRGRLPTDIEVGKALSQAGVERSRPRVNGVPTYHYDVPDLDGCRAAWAKFIGHDMEWPE
jgi:hypothetical protein